MIKMIGKITGTALLILLVFALGMQPALAVEPSTAIVTQENQVPIGEHGTTGDNPLSTSFTFSGNIGMDIDVIPFLINASPSTFVLNGIPAGSTILKASMYVQRWEPPITNSSAVFNGNPLGPIPPFAVDHTGYFSLQSYRFDVTNFVTGSGSFPFSFTTSGGQNYYAALVVVFSHPSKPFQTITINDGSEAIGTGSSTTNFDNLVAGSGILTIVTQADDPGIGTNEAILFNGTTVLGGPTSDIFNANLGPAASLHQLSVTTVNGTNTATITTSGDLFGWHLAIIENPDIQPVLIDIKPGSYPNSINLKSKGKIPVAILSTPTFDAPNKVDKNSLTFGRTGDEDSLNFYNKSFEDVNGDGLLDIMCHFKTQDTGLQIGDTQAILKGTTIDGYTIEGCDSIRIVNK